MSNLSLLKHLDSIKDISHLTADINYTRIHYKGGDSKIVSYTLKRFEELLKPSGEFIRIHRGHLVNRHHIKNTSRYEVLLKNGKRLPVARRRSL